MPKITVKCAKRDVNLHNYPLPGHRIACLYPLEQMFHIPDDTTVFWLTLSTRPSANAQAVRLRMIYAATMCGSAKRIRWTTTARSQPSEFIWMKGQDYIYRIWKPKKLPATKTFYLSLEYLEPNDD